jgi:outer membrane protein assembly factor BamB
MLLRNSLFLLLFLVALPVPAADWPQFRGPGSRGIAAGAEALPADIGPESHIVWKTPLPSGHSSPVIVGGRIFLTAVRDADEGEKEHLETICLDRQTGQIVWRKAAPHTTLEKIHGIGSYAQPSPTADAERVVTMFGSSGLYCYAHDGRELWHVPMGPFNDEFGAASSPVIEAGRVLVCQDHDTGSFLAAYDASTGQPLWRTDRGEFSRGYCTPVVWTVDGRRQVVVAGTLRVCGYDFDSGREVWTVRGLSRVNCMTPVVGGDNRLIVAGWSAGGEPGDRISLEPWADFTAQYDADKSGTLQEKEVGSSVALKTRFTQCDRDKDGNVTRSEYDEFQMLFDKSQNAVLAVLAGAVGDATASHIAWKYDKTVPFCASPLWHDGVVYTVKDGGIFTSLDAATGRERKTGRLTGGGNYYASPVAGDSKLYLLSQRGTLTVVAAAPQWRVIHSAEFGEECYATPALVDGRIYLRTSGHLYCFGR